jgi:hypothetical protein
MFYETTYDGELIQSYRPLTAYMPKLAVAMRRYIGPSTHCETGEYVATLVTELEEEPHGPWPFACSRFARTQRIWRLLEWPVRVGPIVLRLDKGEPGGPHKMYEKIRKVMGMYAELDPMPAGAGPESKASQSRPQSYQPTPQSSQPVQSGFAAPPAAAARDDSNLEARVAALEAMLLGEGQSSDPRLARYGAWLEGPDPEFGQVDKYCPMELRLNRKISIAGQMGNRAIGMIQDMQGTPKPDISQE